MDRQVELLVKSANLQFGLQSFRRAGDPAPLGGSGSSG
jgi:hypothetical protein